MGAAMIMAITASAVVGRAAGGPPGGDASKVAIVGNRTVTRAELEERVRPKLIQIENQRYEALSDGLNELIADELEKQEAAVRGISPGVLEAQEIDAKVTDPTDQEVQNVYDANKAQLAGQTLDQVKPRIVQYLKQQRLEQRRAAFVEELKQKHKTTIMLRPPAFEVATAGRPEKGGGAKAPVTIIEFSDYQCPFCQRAEDVVDQVMHAYGNKVRLVFRDFPLPIHPQARPAAEAASCANAQGKFWEYHAKLFANQSALGEEQLKEYAKDVGLDPAKFEDCLTQKPFSAAIDKDLSEAAKLGINGTPAFFINGRLLSGAQPFEKFKEVIDEELRAKGAAS